MKVIFTFVLAIGSGLLLGQKQELLKDISLTACECIKEASPENSFEMTIGMCMLKGSTPRMDEIKEVLGIDLSDMNNYETLGEVLAPSLMANCPEFMDRMMDAVNEGEIEMEEEMPSEEMPFEEEAEWSDMDVSGNSAIPEFGGPENKTLIVREIPGTNGSGLREPRYKGKITAIKPGLISEISMKSGKSAEEVYYLSGEVDGADLLRKGRSVTLFYRETRRYHAGEGRHRVVKLITRIE